MAAAGAGAPRPQSFCQECSDWLSQAPEMACDNTATIPFRQVLSVDLALSANGRVQLDDYAIASGRPTRVHSRGNRFTLRLDGPTGNLLNEPFDPFVREAAVMGTVYYGYKVPVPFAPSAPPKITMTVLDRGAQVFRGTLYGSAPLGDPGSDVVRECTSPRGALVALDGRASSDQDGDALAFQWSAAGVALTPADGPTPSGWFPLGQTDVSLVVTDGVYGSPAAHQRVTVADSSPPSIALNGPSQSALECGEETYVEEGASASDVCVAGPVSVVVSGDAANRSVPGVYRVRYSASDSAGNTSQVELVVSVADTRAPVITALTATPCVLWPPNHRMVRVIVRPSVRDACDRAPRCAIVQVTASEETCEGGRHHHETDWKIVSDLEVELRADPVRRGPGRFYDILVECKDAAGNSSRRSVRVTVPHNGKH
jgi:hypothetical protein